MAALVEKIPPYIYEQLWPYLPRGNRLEYNGVTIGCRRRVTDPYLPDYLTRYVQGDDPDYEELYVDCLRRYVPSEATVVLVGGGKGVSTVVAAEQVGPSGAVRVYEGGSCEVERTRETVRLNGFEDVVTINHAIVADDLSLRSSAGGAETVLAADLPACDVLGIDADGAEFQILRQLDVRPSTLVVEHHVVLENGDIVREYQPEHVRDLIRDLGYEIVEERSDPTRAYGEFEELILVAEPL